ncbi:MAG TPA: 50S ribosomal protein L9 [bacterium]|jgi:large subunit ribosomal protein L9|nr:50S ribosomal protein L9 [bacterium]
MKVILLHDVAGLGRVGAVKEVKEGYARNFLLPRGLAQEATEGALRVLREKQQSQQDREDHRQSEARTLAAALEKSVVEVKARAGEGGRLFGSVTAQDIADAITARGYNVSKKQVELEDPIHTVGFFKVPVRVAPGVLARVDINVVGAQ